MSVPSEAGYGCQRRCAYSCSSRFSFYSIKILTNAQRCLVPLHFTVSGANAALKPVGPTAAGCAQLDASEQGEIYRASLEHHPLFRLSARLHEPRRLFHVGGLGA